MPGAGPLPGCCCGAFATGGGRCALRLRARCQPHVEHRVQQRVETGALGEHPAGEDTLLLAVEHDLVDLHERGGARRLGRRARVAGARRDLERAELAGLIELTVSCLTAAVTLSRAANTAMALSTRWACAGTSSRPTSAASSGKRALPILLRKVGVRCCIAIAQSSPIRKCARLAARRREKRGASVTPDRAVTGQSWPAPRRRPPGLVVSGRLGPLAAGQDAAGRPVGLRRARHVHAVLLLPGPRRVVFLGRWRIDHVVHPAVPLRRYLRGLGQILVDHPAARHAERADALALDVVAVALCRRCRPACP